MAQSPDWKQLLETGMQFTEMRRSQAKRVAQDLARVERRLSANAPAKRAPAKKTAKKTPANKTSAAAKATKATKATPAAKVAKTTGDGR